MTIVLIFIAPIFQITLSILKVVRVVNIPLSLIFGLAILWGVVLSFTAMKNILDEMTGLGMHCGMPAMGILFAGIFITLTASPIISLVFYLINRSVNRKEIAVK